MFSFPAAHEQFALHQQAQPQQTAEERELELLRQEEAAEEARARARRSERMQRIAELEARQRRKNM
jgi:hypothetical protein